VPKIAGNCFISGGAVALRQHNGVLWITEDKMGTNSISVIDVALLTRQYDIDPRAFPRPHGIAFVPGTKNLLVTTELPYRLVMVDSSSRKVVKDYDVKGKSPHMVMPGLNGQ
jgi:DNA-binding beta-propeller fold protein YncE